MKKFAGALLALVFYSTLAFSKNDEYIQKPTFAVSFIFNDFTSAANVRANSLGTVFKNQQFGKVKNMAPGLALSYIKGMTRNFDFTTTLAGSFVDYPVPNKPSFGRDFLLLEGDVSVRGKMISNKSFINPYLQAGLGVAKYKSYFSTFIPVGAGMQINLFDEAYLLVNAQYRVPMTEYGNYHFYFGFGLAGNIGKR